jgi:hypothetical protein
VPQTCLPNLARGSLAAAFAFLMCGAATAEGPLAALAGSWSGGGTINMSDGATERLRCRVNYSVGGGGTSASQDLRCASDSYRVDIRSNVALNGPALVGTWTETTRGVSGQVSGSVNGGDIAATVRGPNFGAGLSIATRGTSQSVNIRLNAGDVSSVSLTLRKN